MILGVVQEEKKRLEELISFYQNKIQGYPKGSLSLKKRYNREYAYLAYRNAGKVHFDYIGQVDSEKVMAIKEQIQARKKAEKQLKESKEAYKEVKRLLREK